MKTITVNKEIWFCQKQEIDELKAKLNRIEQRHFSISNLYLDLHKDTKNKLDKALEALKKIDSPIARKTVAEIEGYNYGEEENNNKSSDSQNS